MYSALRPLHVAVGILALGLVAACSSDKTTTPDDGDDAGSGGGSGVDSGSGGGGSIKPNMLDDGGISCPGATPINDNGSCITKAEAVPACKTRSEKSLPGTKTDDPSCGAGCTCEKCTQAMIACGNDPDNYCPTVIACANAHSCTGVDCYQDATCKTVIDAAPNGGISSGAVALAGDVGECIKPSKGPMMGQQICSPTCP